MAIRRTPRALKFKKPKSTERDPKAWKPCVTCGVEHQGGQPGTFVMPSLLDPTLYACSYRCYNAWVEAKKASGEKVDPTPSDMAGMPAPGQPLF